MDIKHALSEYFRFRLDLADGTKEQYRIAARHWENFFGCYPVDRTTADLLVRFAEWLLSGRMTPQTVNKTMRHTLPVVRHSGADVKWRPLRELRRAPRAFLATEFSSILDAASREYGTVVDVPAGKWWRSLLLSIWYSGARIGAIMAVTPKDMLIDQGGFYLRAEHQKQHADQFFRVGADAIEAISEIYDENRDIVWPWPFRRELLYRRFRVICGSAGVELGKGTGSLFHRIRKSTASYMKLNGGDATSHLGHSCSSVTQRYFDPRIVSSHDSRSFMPSLAD